MDPSWSNCFLLSAVLAIILLGQLWRNRHRPGPYPPGPPGLPIIGNFFDIPRSAPWIQFAEWGKKYGMPNPNSLEFFFKQPVFLRNMPILYLTSSIRQTHISSHDILRLQSIPGPVTYLNLLGRPLIVLNTAKATIDLLERRGGNYANRPGSIMVGEMYVFSC